MVSTRDINLEVISRQKVLKAVAMDEITKGMSTDAAPTSAFRSRADEEDPARENESQHLERQKENQASVTS